MGIGNKSLARELSAIGNKEYKNFNKIGSKSNLPNDKARNALKNHQHFQTQVIPHDQIGFGLNQSNRGSGLEK
jgi:hypothetical protein